MGGQKTVKQIMRLLRLLDNKQQPIVPEQDPILISIDLEVSRSERAAMLKKESHLPYVKELGIAILDVRNIFSPPTPPTPTTTPPEGRRLVVTKQYSTQHASDDFEDCDFTDFQECVFAKTVRIRHADIVLTIERCLRVPDSPNSGQLRPVLLVGHSIKQDLNVLQRLGLDLTSSSHPTVIGVLDTHSLSRHILPTPGRFTLAAVLDRLSCPHEAHGLHNAGNDATYTIFAVLLLAVVWSSDQQRQVTETQTDNRRLIGAFASHEIEAPRWKPIRRALGAHAQE